MVMAAEPNSGLTAADPISTSCPATASSCCVVSSPRTLEDTATAALRIICNGIRLAPLATRSIFVPYCVFSLFVFSLLWQYWCASRRERHDVHQQIVNAKLQKSKGHCTRRHAPLSGSSGYLSVDVHWIHRGSFYAACCNHPGRWQQSA